MIQYPDIRLPVGITTFKQIDLVHGTFIPPGPLICVKLKASYHVFLNANVMKSFQLIYLLFSVIFIVAFILCFFAKCIASYVFLFISLFVCTGSIILGYIAIKISAFIYVIQREQKFLQSLHLASPQVFLSFHLFIFMYRSLLLGFPI